MSLTAKKIVAAWPVPRDGRREALGRRPEDGVSVSRDGWWPSRRSAGTSGEVTIYDVRQRQWYFVGYNRRGSLFCCSLRKPPEPEDWVDGEAALRNLSVIMSLRWFSSKCGERARKIRWLYEKVLRLGGHCDQIQFTKKGGCSNF